MKAVPEPDLGFAAAAVSSTVGRRAAAVRPIRSSDAVVRVGRRLLADGGSDALTLRAVARELGVSPPALYNHIGSRQALLRSIAKLSSASLTAELQAAVRDLPPDDLARPFVTAAFALRNWALRHRHEYELLFDSAPEGSSPRHPHAIGMAFLTLVVRHWDRRRLPWAADRQVPSALRSALATSLSGDLAMPTAAACVLIDCWIRLQGFLALEVFGHLSFALPNATPLFERVLADIATSLAPAAALTANAARI